MISPVVLADIPQIELFVIPDVYHCSESLSPPKLQHYVALNHCVKIVTDDHKLQAVGLACCSLTNFEIMLYLVYVGFDYQGLGLSTQILRHYKHFNFRVMVKVPTFQNHLIQFYQYQGFEEDTSYKNKIRSTPIKKLVWYP